MTYNSGRSRNLSQKSVLFVMLPDATMFLKWKAFVRVMKTCAAFHYPQEQLSRIQQCKPRVGGTAYAFQASNGQASSCSFEIFSQVPYYGIQKKMVNVNLRKQKETRVEKGISCKKQKPPSSCRRYSLSRERRFVVVKSCIKHCSHEAVILQCTDASASPI
jgi:hypothetical protein